VSKILLPKSESLISFKAEKVAVLPEVGFFKKTALEKATFMMNKRAKILDIFCLVEVI